ncbi:hypothetical protein ACLKMH_15280 [Psychromonas sp. KJ10-10]|uniref:hypothetical protein n=1 Tax=Psychromonas sp. KJ10-10 TaxID=3391823 RepID=UPI0039B5285C
MIEYVNTKEVEALAPLVDKLLEEYKKDNDWSQLQGEHKIFGTLIFKQLQSSEFQIDRVLPEKQTKFNKNPPLTSNKNDLRLQEYKMIKDFPLIKALKHFHLHSKLLSLYLIITKQWSLVTTLKIESIVKHRSK